MKFSRLWLLVIPGLFSSLASAHDDPAQIAAGSAIAASLPTGSLGQGAWLFKVEAGWTKLPADRKLGPTHGGVAVDRAGNVYVSSDGPESVLVFAPDGKFLRSLAPQLNGIHGLVLRTEGGVEYLYGAHLIGHQVVKLALDGTVLWTIGVPVESGLYAKPGDYKPTAIAVAPDGRLFVADGYGASVIHEYSADRKWLRTIGTKGVGDGQFKTCHGLLLDERGPVAQLLVCDRENRRLVQLDLDGKFVRTIATGLRRPCAVAIHGDSLAVAELEGRVAILDRTGTVVATLGDNPDKTQWATNKVPADQWRDGIFTAPHGLAFDATGNLYVQDWNLTGRLSKLRRIPAGLALAR